MRVDTTFSSTIPAALIWVNQPSEFSVNNGLHITTDPQTDFWQRTHYGFRNDTGHCLLATVEGDFELTTAVRFQAKNQYDQCGPIVRVDAENWIKVSAEYVSPQLAELGSVVTNLGYSDWATTPISPEIQHMWYRISRRGDDFFLQNAYDGENWQQMRICHMHAARPTVQAGLYACTPTDGRFTCTFEHLHIAENQWQAPE